MARALNRGSTIAWALMGLLAVGISLFSYRYLFWIGPLAPNVIANPHAHPWLVVHVAGACTALLVGSFQFLLRVRDRFPKWHRWVGRIYVAACLTGGAGAIPIALTSTAGPVATAGFGGLAIGWLVTTVRGWQLARERRFVEHRRWMIRSWALTLAAVTLRLYLPMVPIFGLPFMDSYRAISFLCWVPNLLIAELYLRRKRLPPDRRLAAA